VNTIQRRKLLCRPRGGLNDMVSQIERCCRYAELTNRAVIVDTNYGADSFGDDFDHYFISRQQHLILSAKGLDHELDCASTFPPSLTRRMSSYKISWDQRKDGFVEWESGELLTFDFNKDYPHELLVHQQHGRLPISASIFMRLSLQPALTKELLARVAKIGGPYLGVHVRHTDYRSDYRPLFGQLAGVEVPKLFVATDNQKVLDEFRAALPGKQIFSFAEELSNDGNPIHLRGRKVGNVYRRNCDAILDLLLLALSVGIVSADLLNGRRGLSKSGFTVLAMELLKQKRYLSELLGPAVKIGLD
jgi:hypothetical protein